MSREVLMKGGPLDGQRKAVEARYVEAVESLMPPRVARYEVRGDEAVLVEVRDVRLS